MPKRRRHNDGTMRRQSLWALGSVLLLHSTPTSLAQQPSEVHFFAECRGAEEGGCYIMNYYCRLTQGACVPCPNDGVAVTEEDCWMDNNNLDSNNATAIVNITTTGTQRNVQQCIDSCVKPQAGDACSESNACDERQSFCNYDSTISFNTTQEDEQGELITIEESEYTGTCQACYEDVTECVHDPSIHNSFGREDCTLCDDRTCFPMHYSIVQEQKQLGQDNTTISMTTTIDSNALRGSPQQTVSGRLVDCTNLIYENEHTCNDDTISATDPFLCLVNDKTRNTLYIDVITKCEALGGRGVVLYGDFEPRTPNNETWVGNTNFETANIPSVSIPYDDGERLQQQILQQSSAASSTTTTTTILTVNVTNVGTVCWKQQFCSDDIPCLGYNEGSYCDYKWSHGTEGFCRSCPTDGEGNPDPLSCFFNRQDVGSVTAQKAIESCATTCASELQFPECKFCPEDVTGFDFMDSDNGGEQCHFCPDNDVLYPQKEFPLFGEGIQCWQVQKLFETAHIDASSTNCQLAQMMNYVCGCAGPGYAGASSQTKKAVLAWLPRIMALLSMAGSSYIVYDNCASADRTKVMNQLLMALSVFDILGSIGYALTTLPMPENDPYGPFYGAHGTDATCSLQAFLIQMGTISALLNCSLACYYLLVIQYSWPESRAKSIRVYLFGVPLLVGFTFALAGIPYYGSLVVWCNNTANYWPDIPVALAIGLATLIMTAVCWHVYQKDQTADKWRSGVVSTRRNGRGRQRLSTRVFWQAFWYLMAFYMTWPVYLALQYSWASGSSFTRYGWTLAAASMVPLQGFWNFLVYVRPRYMNQAMQSIRRSFLQRPTGTTRSSASGGFGGIWSKLWSGEHHKSNDGNPPPSPHLMGMSDDDDDDKDDNEDDDDKAALPQISSFSDDENTHTNNTSATRTTTANNNPDGSIRSSRSNTSHHYEPRVLLFSDEEEAKLEEQ